MKEIWLVALGLMIGLSVSSFHSPTAPQISDRSSVLLSRDDLDQLSLAIDGLTRADLTTIYRYEAGSPSVLVLECVPGRETTCRLETQARSTSAARSTPSGSFEVVPLDPTLTHGRARRPSRPSLKSNAARTRI